MNDNQNQNQTQTQTDLTDVNFDEYLKKKKGKKIRAYIALALTVALIVVSVTVALFRAADGEDLNSDASFEASVNEESVESGNGEASEEALEGSNENESSEINEYFPAINVITPEHVTAAGIYELSSSHCVYSANADGRLSIASITKLITASVAIKYVPLDTVFTVGSEMALVKYDSSVCGLKQGYRLTLEQLLYGLLMSSGNDAAYTVAVNVARYASKDDQMSDNDAVAYFCGLMNDLADEIGAVNSSFANPEGWDDENNYSTVSDLVIISKYATSHELIKKIASTVEYTVNIASGEEMKFRNSNFMLHPENRFYDPLITGLKTGSTNNAGKCLVATVNIDGFEYLAIVMGCPNEETRYSSMATLINYIKEYNNLKFA